MTYALLGTVVKCQVSAQALVREGRYIRDDIVDAAELHLDADGVVGWCDGRAVLHHHHRANPKRRNWKPNRLLSIGFTGHYRAMADRFGDAPLGCGAENIIVDADHILTEDDLASVQLRTTTGVTADLAPAAVAKPCVPFTKYLLDDQCADDETVAPNRAFLDNGMRGFVFGLADHIERVMIAPGDELWTTAG